MKNPIRIYNRFLDLKVEIDTYQSLQFGRDYHGIADFELHVNRYMHEAKRIFKGDIIGLNKQDNKVGIILTKEIALDESGKESENFKLTGTTLDGLMSRRLTVPPSSTAYDRKNGDTETVMKHYVNNHFVNPANSRRKMPHVEIAPNYNRGAHLEWESRFKNVADELENISIKSGLGWGIFADFKTKKLIFDVIEAKDLTQDNPFGNSPVFFSPEFETIKSQSYIDSDNELKTVGYVGGQGEGTERKIVTIGNNAGWDRIETFVDARDVGNSENDEEELTPEEIEQQLEERGTEKMSGMETLRSLEAEILTPVRKISPFQYEKDFDLGDNVQVVNKSWGLQMIAPITQFKEIHETGGFRLEATFGRSRPTLISKIKNKFDELDGIEKQELPAQIAVDTKKYTDRELSKEEQERIQQAKDNLETSKQYTEDYAEKKHVESPTEPADKDVIWVDTSDPVNVVWKVWRDGEWKAGPGGPQGLPGEPGEDGTPRYTWLKYADLPTSGMSDSPANKDYIGLAYNKLSPTESTNYADYAWSKVVGPKGDKGNQGVEGPAGSDGQPTYTWIKYADTVTGGGFSDSPNNKEYIGLAYNKTVQAESSNPEDYTWAKIKGDKGEKGDTGERGLQGIQGPEGDQGIRGVTGADGTSSYTHVAYANNSTGTSGFSVNDSTNKKYIGIYVDEVITDPNDPVLYNWTLIKGADGEQGIQGAEGKDGRTPFLHIAYSNDSTGSTDFSISDSTNRTYIGTYTDYISGDSTDHALYTWTKIQGPIGPQGNTGEQGPQGDDGLTAYTHIAYATNETGTSGFSITDSSGKTYIGMYTDHTAGDSVTPSVYNWSLIKGADGSRGIQGPTGDDGRTSYLHIAYANNSTGSSGFSTTNSSGKDYIGQYTDFTAADSGSYTSYNWTLVKGPQGATGTTGPTGPEGEIGPQGPNIVDSTTEIAVNVIKANHLDVANLAAITANLGTINAGKLIAVLVEGITGTFGSVSVSDENLYLEDSNTGTKNLAVFKANLLKDHSFESMGVNFANSYGNDIYDAVGNISNGNTGWFLGVGTARIQTAVNSTYGVFTMFGYQTLVVNHDNNVSQDVIVKSGENFNVSFHTRKAPGHAAGSPKLSFNYMTFEGIDVAQEFYIFPAVSSEDDILRYHYTGTMPAGADFVRVYLSAADTGWVMYDGLQLVLGETPTLYNPEDSLSQLLNGFLRAKKLYADEFEAKSISFQDSSAAEFDKYGNIGARSIASPTAYWAIKDYNGNTIMKVFWGSDRSQGVQIIDREFRVYGDVPMVMNPYSAHGTLVFNRAGNSDYIAFHDSSAQPGVFYFVADGTEESSGGNPYSQATALLYAGSYNFGSQRERKSNIKRLEKPALQGVKNSHVYRFNYKKHERIKGKLVEEPYTHTGLMYEEIPDEIKGIDDSISLNSMTSYLWKALQEENEEREQENKELKAEVSNLKETVNQLVSRTEALENAK